MIAFHVERVADCWDEVYALAKLHHDGTQSYRRHEPFLPSRDRYVSYNELGYFHLITARSDGKLVGYFGVYITPSMHSQLLMATEDTFFIHPDYRQGRLAIRMLKYIESYCRNAGVHELLFSCEQDNTSGIHGLLSLLAYEPVIVQYRKHLSSPGTDSAATIATVGGQHVSNH